MAVVSSSDLATQNSNLQSAIAASQQQAKNEDPDGIFELLSELFNQAASFLGKVSPVGKVSGLLSVGITANINIEQSAPLSAAKPIKPGGEGGAQGGVLAKGLSKVLGFKNFFSGLSAPTIEALAHIGESIMNVSWSDLGGLSPQSFAGNAIAQDVGMSGAGHVG